MNCSSYQVNLACVRVKEELEQGPRMNLVMTQGNCMIYVHFFHL
jgi:hypothetical protein